MADPTLKDVIDAIAQLRAETRSDIARLDSKVDVHRAETRSDIARLDSKVDVHRAETAAHRAETAKAFADLDRELSKHADVHRELEKDVEAIKRRPARTAARPTTRRR